MKEVKNRPPRIYIGKQGKRYIKLKGKKVYIKSKIDNKILFGQLSIIFKRK